MVAAMAISDKKYDELQSTITSLSKKGQQENETDLYQFSLSRVEFEKLKKILEDYFSTKKDEEKSEFLVGQSIKNNSENKERAQDIKEAQEPAKELEIRAKALEEVEKKVNHINDAQKQLIDAQEAFNKAKEYHMQAKLEISEKLLEINDAHTEEERALKDFNLAQIEEKKLEVAFKQPHSILSELHEMDGLREQLDKDPDNPKLNKQLVNKEKERIGLQNKKAPLQSLKEQLEKAKEITQTCKNKLLNAKTNLKEKQYSLKKAKINEKKCEAIEKLFEKAYEDAKKQVTNSQGNTSSQKQNQADSLVASAQSAISPPIPNRLTNLMTAKNRLGKVNVEESKLKIAPNKIAPGA